MMKKIIFAITAVLAVSTISPAQALGNSSVVIIDNGFDASLLGGSVVKELCITSINIGCNNGRGLDESPNASSSPVKISQSFLKEWNHGTIMADIVRQVNPNARLILIRTARVTNSGSVINGSDKDFQAALTWVIQNKSKYNVSAVSFSRGQHVWTKKANAVCPVDQAIRSSIISLQNIGVPVVIATGNNGDKRYVDYPSCISEAVAISGIVSYSPKIWSSYGITWGTNAGLDTDFYAYGNFNTVLGPVAESTSSSTAAFAGYWSKVSNGNYFETYEKLSKSTSNKFINVLN